ncbi:MAG: site-2 protease family protein [Sulfolobales archaeon]
MNSNEKSNALELMTIINKFFSVIESFRNNTFTEYVVISSKEDMEKSFSKLYDELVVMNYYPILYNTGDVTVLRVINGGKARLNVYRLSSILFGLTLISVLITGYFISLNFCNNLSLLGSRVAQSRIIYEMSLFALSVLIPLIMHEVGHLLIVKESNIPASYPIFIPAPIISPLGTFGAIVRMEFLPKNLTALLRLGISGPLMGFITSLIIFSISYSLSPRIPIEVAQAALSEGLLGYIEIVPVSVYLIMNLIEMLSDGRFVTVLNPAAYASLIMILIHFINLLPIGQLDGGHVIRGVTSVKTHSMISLVTVLIMVIFSLMSTLFLNGALVWLGVFSILALFLSGFKPHIGVANMLETSAPISIKTRILIIYFLILTLSTPLPPI